MNSAENLINRILSDSETLKSNIISDAESKAEKIISAANSEAEKLKDTSKKQSDERYIDIVARGKTVAELDSKKIVLRAKKQMIEESFSLAKQKIADLPDAEYLKFIGKLIKEYGEDGDEAVISNKDEKRITSDAISKIASSSKVKVKLSKEKGNFIGGIMLKNGGEYKNLTIEMLIAERYSNLEMQVLSKLNI